MVEIWRSVTGYEGYYEVSDQGRVRSIDRLVHRREKGSCVYPGRILKARSTGWAMAVGLYKGGKWKGVSVHRIVLEAFVGPCPDGLEGCHNDGDYRNNNLANLRWDTHGNNTFDSIRHGTHHSSRKIVCAHEHQFSANNTYVAPNGERACRTCRIESGRRYYQRNRDRILARQKDRRIKKRMATLGAAS